ncbi:MAG: aminotransferase class III-fold pyridoxal phosphate-dependent enzyme [Rhodovarius sp.]|nr:aminotransferase class III-fold pyridoxal phosphate-dependent enzyme [Rhodovarius sp.]
MTAPAAARNADLEAALADARARYAAARPRSAALHAAARQALPGGNTRSVLFYSPFPTAMLRGEGARLWDADGRAYLDLLGEYSAGLFGHSHPRIIAAVQEVLARGINLGAVGPAEGELARLLVARFPALERVRFTNSGTEANLMALAAARAFTGRVEVMVVRGGYHGGVLSFAGGGSPVNLPMPFHLIDYNDAEAAARAIHALGERLAAVLVEPMLGAGGCIPARPDFLVALREATRAVGALLIFDEVMTSRHHEGGMHARLGIIPDLLTLGKYIAGGMSCGAFGGRAEVMDLFDAHRPGALPHAGTFNNNALSMAAGLVAMGEIFRGAAVEALFARGEALRGRLQALCAGLPMQVSGLGSMLCVHFREGPIERPYTATPREEALRELFFLDMMEAGIYLARRGMMTLSLPLADADIERAVAAVAEFVALRRGLIAGEPA